MLLLIKKITLENIKQHKHFVFEPMASGITAIQGPTGSGKSTIVEAFAWSLFGTKRSGLKNKSFIKEGVNPKEKTSRVIVDISINSQDYRIERRFYNQEGGHNCTVYSVENGVIKEKLSGPGVSHSEAFIKELLGIDEKSFLSSIFIQQKQVDQIISASPKERGEVIEKLTGITSITKGASLARDEARGLQKAASIIQTGDLEQEYQKYINSKNNIEKVSKYYNNLKKEFNITKQELKDVTDLYEKETDNQELFKSKKQKYELLSIQIKTLTDTLNENIKLFEPIKKSKTKSYGDEASIKNELDTVTKDKNNITNNIYNIKKDIESLTKILSVKIPTGITKKQKEIQSNIETIETNIQTENSNVLYMKSEISHKKEYIKALMAGETECPICKSSFEADENIVEKEKAELKNIQKEAKSKIEYINTLKEELSTLEKQQKEVNKLIDIQKEQKEAKKIYKEKTQELSKLEEEQQSLTATYNVLYSRYSDIQVQKQLLEQMKTLKETIKQTKEKIVEFKEQEAVLVDELKSINVMSKGDYTNLYKKLTTIENKYNKIRVEGAKTQGELKTLETECANNLANYNRCKKANEEYKELTTELSSVNLSAQTLSKFKEDRMQASLPTLTEIASSILHRFTDGRFTRLELDEHFDAYVVTNSGVTRYINETSGGEQSSAAIALRLAISLFLNNGQPGLLILDEVLVSMDNDTAQDILDTIASISGGQTIIIAHNSGINTYADKVVSVI